MFTRSVLHTATLAALAASLAACASLTSTTMIDPGKSFRLGGDQRSAFTVRGSNAGPVPVIVFVEQRGTRDSVTTLAPGAPVDARFPSGSTAIFMNTSRTQVASVAITVTGDINGLDMRYEQNAKR